ncbi:MAG TPA: LptE family protein [Terriglobales bacterium]|nr:LptE family protein [Terriglobales bacterium]
MRTVAVALLPLLCLVACGCGYHAAGHVVTLPENVHTIAIPAFTNRSQTYRIEQMLTAAVIHEFTLRTRYRIAYDPAQGADATLRGTVLGTSVIPTTYDSQTGRANTVQIAVAMSVTLTDSSGKILYQNPSYYFRDNYEVAQDLNSFFQEDTAALQRISRQFARSLVSNILEGY